MYMSHALAWDGIEQSVHAYWYSSCSCPHNTWLCVQRRRANIRKVRRERERALRKNTMHCTHARTQRKEPHCADKQLHAISIYINSSPTSVRTYPCTHRVRRNKMGISVVSRDKSATFHCTTLHCQPLQWSSTHFSSLPLHGLTGGGERYPSCRPRPTWTRWWRSMTRWQITDNAGDCLHMPCADITVYEASKRPRKSSTAHLPLLLWGLVGLVRSPNPFSTSCAVAEVEKSHLTHLD